MYENSSCPLTDMFMDVQPYYIAIGMTDEQFWQGDVWLAKTYRQAHNLKVEMRNQQLYMAGAYNFQGISAALANFAQGFSKHKSKPVQYLDKPIRITPLSEREQKLERKKAENVVRMKLKVWQEKFKKLQPQEDSTERK